ncbi:MAG: glycosyltransferase family 1 protein [Acidobacteria bacterium]|nr:glycosyltransferase family 1 protein [Acidobacteriota bacterium]
MRVLLAPHGTRGDVQPTIALALALRARGHEASFVAPSNFVAWIRAHGFDAESNGVDVEGTMRSESADLHSLRWLMRHLIESLAPLFTSIARASEHCDLIVGAGAQIPAASVAEWRDVSYVAAAFCPCAVPSSSSPPPTVRTQTLPRWVNRLLWQLGGPIADLALRPAINRGRAQLGLRTLDSPIAQLMNGHVLVAADPDLAPLVTTRVPDLAAQTLAEVRALERGAIVAGGWAGLDRHIAPADDVLVVESVPHHLVLPRVAAAIHHGGAGTTTAVARAGVPQVILPHILDQYYWAHRIEALGLGPRPLPVDLVTADILADRLDAALGDPRIREGTAALGPAIAARNGVTAAVDYLESLA